MTVPGDLPGTAGTASLAGVAEALLDAAEAAIREHFARGHHTPPSRQLPPTPDRSLLLAPGASFVTLLDGHRLLGCIGSLEPYRPLVDDVAANAVAAAFEDPRLPPLRPDEFRTMTVKVSVLSPRVPLAVHSVAELVAAARPGIDGLVAAAGRRRGTFLPSVWEQLPDPRDFVEHLWHKAGLVPGSWPPGTTVERYTTEEFGRDGPRPL